MLDLEVRIERTQALLEALAQASVFHIIPTDLQSVCVLVWGLLDSSVEVPIDLLPTRRNPVESLHPEGRANCEGIRSVLHSYC